MKKCKRCDKEIPRNNYCGKCYTLNFRERNPGRMEELCAKYYEDNKEHVVNRVKQYNKDNAERQAKNHSKWIKETNYDNNRYKKDIQYRLVKIQRARINAALKNINKSKSTKELIGCSIEQFKEHLQSKFHPNPETGEIMTWDNYGKYGWHIDHIIPLSKYDLTDESQLKEACNYVNLRPMWWRENIKKSNKITIYLLVGAPGAGKSWVANQLKNTFDYVSFDEVKKSEHVAKLQTLSHKYKLYDPTFKISTFIKHNSNKFDIKLVGIYEHIDVLRARIASRGGEWTDTVLIRNEKIKRYINKYGGFLGTSQEVLKYLQSVV